MTQRSKLELQINEPKTIELLYDEPVIGESKYGNYYLYAVKSENNEFSFFAPEEVHKSLSELSLQKGDSATIIKKATQNGSRINFSYEVKSTSPRSTSQSKTEIDETNVSDGLQKIMLQSYRDAQSIQRMLEFEIEITKIAITLYITRVKNPTKY